MATESRIGIAFGFVIVAIASVYFIYGSDRSDGDLLLTDEKVAKTDAKKDVTQPSTKSTTKKTNTTPNAADTRRSASSHSKGSRKNAAKPAINKAPNNTRLANRGNQKPTSATKPTPRRNKPNPVLARNNNTVPTRRDPMRITKGADEAAKTEKETDATNPITRIARNQADRTPFRGPTPLNSNASKSLVDATEKNLKEAEAAKADDAKSEDQSKPVVRRTPNRSQPTRCVPLALVHDEWAPVQTQTRHRDDPPTPSRAALTSKQPVRPSGRTSERCRFIPSRRAIRSPKSRCVITTRRGRWMRFSPPIRISKAQRP